MTCFWYLFAVNYLPYISWYEHGDVHIDLVLEYCAGDDGHDGRHKDDHHGQGVVSCLWVMPLPVLDIQVCGEEEGEDGEEGGHPEESQERPSDRVQRLMDSDGMSIVYVEKGTWWPSTAWDTSGQLQLLYSDSLLTFSPR